MDELLSDDHHHLVQADDHLNGANHTSNTLMLSNVWSYLPTSRHHAWVCSAGSTGYCALEEMLQNGTPGNTLLLESCDLRDMDGDNTYCCCLVHTPFRVNHTYLPSSISPSRITIYSNLRELPYSFLNDQEHLQSIDMSPMRQLKDVGYLFLHNCPTLSSLDLNPLPQISGVCDNFLHGCSGLKSLDLTPLSKVTEVGMFFLVWDSSRAAAG